MRLEPGDASYSLVVGLVLSDQLPRWLFVPVVFVEVSRIVCGPCRTICLLYCPQHLMILNMQ